MDANASSSSTFNLGESFAQKLNQAISRRQPKDAT
jgi:hypothetical protein